MKTLTLVSLGQGRPELTTMLKMEQDDQYPRASLYGTELNSELLDERFLERVPPFRKAIYRHLRPQLTQIIEAFVIKGRYDLVVSWAENLGLPFALLLKLTCSRVPHIAIWSWISKKKKARVLQFVQSHVDRICLMSSRQRDFAVKELGIPEKRIAFLRWPVDTKFWRPMDVPTDMICSVGREMRDFPTLIRAMEGLDIRCHIATGAFRGVMDSTVKAIYDMGKLPDNVTVGKLNLMELRTMYARSKFVVIPLLPTDTDNGTTSIIEAMAMGKAVICSQAEGQVDVIRHGENGLFVPLQDPKALREAILYLWNSPSVAEAMGREGRKLMERDFALDSFVGKVKVVAEELVAEYRSR